MFSNIPELLPVIVLAATFVISLIGVIQYSRYEAHRKAHIQESEESIPYRLASKFSIIPYLIVPVCFGAVQMISALFLVDILAGRGYIAGGEISYAAVAQSIAIYLLADKLVVRQCGNAVYFDTIEDKFFQSVTANIQQKVKEEDGNRTVTLSYDEYEKLMRK